MTDCPNGEMRDALPDLLHDRLAPDARRVVEAHLAGCADCRSELALLGELRADLHRAPMVDVSAIAAAIPAYRPALSLSTSRGSWASWRVAAAIVALAAGGASVAVLSRGSDVQPAAVVAVSPGAVSVPAAPAPDSAPMIAGQGSASPARVAAPPATRVAVARPSSAVPAAVRELAVGSSATGDLTDREMTELLKAVESIDALPSTDVEGATVTPTRGGS